MINVSVKANPEKLAKLAEAMQPERTDTVIDGVANLTFARVVRATPKKWFGQVRSSWQMERPGLSKRVVVNRNKIMLWLEEGTADGGRGYIYPKKARALYIPLNRRASFGWRKTFKYGVDYILRKRVRGISPRLIVKAQSKIAQETLFQAMKRHIRQAISG